MTTLVVGNSPSHVVSLQFSENRLDGTQQSRLLGQPRRLKHGAKMGKHLETLDEMAHEKSRSEAKEKRKKKKMKKGGKSKEVEAATIEETFESNMESLEESFVEDEDSVHEVDDDEDEDLLPDLGKVKERMKKILDSFEESLKAIRGAEPTPELFDGVNVEAYGTTTNLKSVAQVVISSPTLANATCFDPQLAKNVSRAIQNQMGLNPTVEEGGNVKIPLPRVSMETRQKTVNTLNKRAESSRQRMRKVRRSSLEIVKKGVAGKLEGVSKDDAFRVQKEIEDATQDMIQKLNEVVDKKHKSIMEV